MIGEGLKKTGPHTRTKITLKLPPNPEIGGHDLERIWKFKHLQMLEMFARDNMLYVLSVI